MKMRYKDRLLNYSNWIDEIILNYIDNLKLDINGNYKDFVEDNGFFITFKFNIKSIVLKNDIEFENYNRINEFNMTSVRHLYNKICNNIYGRKFMKLKQELPKVIMCSDVNHTRYWSKKGDIENLHIHSLWIVPPNIKEKFIDILTNYSSDIRKYNFGINEIHFIPIDNYNYQDDKPSTLASYTAKFIPFNSSDITIESDIRILPEYESVWFKN